MPKTTNQKFSLISSASRGVIHAYEIAFNEGSVFKRTWCGKSVDGKGRREDRLLHAATLLPMSEEEMLERITCKRCSQVWENR